jgi:DNA (cytosine-5)-methyltransferase 1
LAYPDEARRDGEEWTDHRDRLARLARDRKPTYVVTHQVLNAADYGVPQVRHRVFVVGFRSDLGRRFRFPEATHGLDALLVDQWITGGYWARHRLLKPEPPAPLPSRLANLDLFALATKPYRTVRDAVSDLPEPTDSEPKAYPNHRLQPGARSYVGHTGSPLDHPAKTLKAGDHGVPGGENVLRRPDETVRYFTVREAARLQTFPDRWRFRGAWTEAMRQIGNAVPVDLAKIVAESVAAQLN